MGVYDIAGNMKLADPAGAYQEGQANALAQRINQFKLSAAQNEFANSTEDRQASKDKATATQALAAAQWAAQPGVTKDQVARANPGIQQDFERLHGPGSFATASDEDVRKVAQIAVQHYSSQLGISPPKQEEFTMSPDQVRYRMGADGAPPTVVASGPAKPPVPESYQHVILDNGNIGKFNSRTGQVQDTGVKGVKPGSGMGMGGGLDPAERLDPVTRRTAAIVVMSDPARMRDYATFGKTGQQARTDIQKNADQERNWDVRF
jgi:hypothetical protein